MAENCRTADYADSDISPVAGCDGCELWASTEDRIMAAVSAMENHGWDTRAATEVARRVLGSQTPSLIHQGSEVLAGEMVWTLCCEHNPEAINDIAQALQKGSRCQAGSMAVSWGPNPFDPNHVPSRGWHSRFESPTLHAGALWTAARWGALNKFHPDKPWLTRHPRIVLISQTGEALSDSVPFEFLRDSIITPVSSASGRRHVYLWNTRRCARMADFSDWLIEQGWSWPPNLIPLGSVSRMAGIEQLAHLRRIPATFRGILAQPMLEPLEMYLTGFGWVIVGGETGADARPFDIQWARVMRQQCLTARCPFFANRVGWNLQDDGIPITGIRTRDRHFEAWPEELRVRDLPMVLGSPIRWPVAPRLARV
jgi:protein gp37